LKQLDGVGLLIDVFFRVDFGFGGNPRLRKKLLRFATGFSAAAVVAPVEIWHFSFSGFTWQFG
jgi:hypothetical protein